MLKPTPDLLRLLGRIALRPLIYLEFNGPDYMLVLQMARERMLALDYHNRFALGRWAQRSDAVIPNDLMCEYVRRRRAADGHPDPEQKTQRADPHEVYSAWDWLAREENRRQMIEQLKAAAAPAQEQTT
jgi:hypothetical protein